jgi:hypothetical protein
LQIQEFIEHYLPSVDHLRALLVLQSELETDWSATELAAKLYLRPEPAAEVLAQLQTKGLLASAGEPRRYRYRPQSPELASLVDQVARLDRERPVTLLNMIYARPRDIQAVADAFKLRKDKEH